LYNPHGNAGSFDFARPITGGQAIAAQLPEDSHPSETGRQLISRVNSLSDSLGEWRERLAAWLASAVRTCTSNDAWAASAMLRCGVVVSARPTAATSATERVTVRDRTLMDGSILRRQAPLLETDAAP